MKAHDAIKLVNGAVFKPGWRLVADYQSLYSIRLGFVIDTVDTSTPDEQGRYTEQRTLGPARVIEVRDLEGEEDLAYEILKFAADMDTHENREFLRFRRPDGSWRAPLHPHTLDGELAWAFLEYKSPARY
jgi:hypothetical protein